MKKSIFFKSLIFAFTLLSFVSIAQVPANDLCAGATSFTPGGPCLNGTTINATDNISTTAGCQAGGNGNAHNDVWYSFVATGTQFTATLTASAPFTGNIEFLLVSGACGTQTIVNTTCGASPLGVTVNGLTAGTTYYIIVSKQGSGTDGPFTICNYATTTPTSNCTANETCATSQSITLNAVGGGSICTTGCNTGAGPGLDFTGNNCYDTPNATVWYSFTTGATVATINVSLTSTVMTNPEFTIFSNTNGCAGPYTILSCLEGTAGSAVTNSITVTPNTTYFVTVSDATGDEGNFNLCIAQNADNSACNTNDALVVSATSMGSPLAGPYIPGEIVSFCYTITNWQQINCNYLGAVVPTFGTCWDPASFNAQGMPLSITTPLNVNGVIQPCPPGPPCAYGACAGTAAGSWNWFPAGAATYNVAGGSLPVGAAMGAGWYFLSSYNPLTGACTGGDPTDPDNTFGDGNFPACGTNTFDYTLCFNLIAGPTGNCTAGATDCGVNMKTYADGEFGAWNSVGCMVDNASVSSATLACCAQPNMTSASSATICSGNTVSIPLTSDVASTYSWIAAANANVTGESTTAQTTATLSNLLTNTTTVVQTVIYTVTPVSTTSCTGFPQTVTVTVNPTPTSTASTTGTLTCSVSTVALNSTLSGMNYTWTAPAGGSVGSANTQSTTASGAAGVYTLNIQSAAGCSYSTTTSVTQNTTTPLVSASNTTTLTCTTTTAALTGGPASGVTYQWSGAGFSGSTTAQNAVATAPGTYTLLVTGTVNSCTTAATTAVSQNTTAPAGVSAGVNQTLTCLSSSVALTGVVATPTNATVNWTGANICGSPTTAVTSACGAGVYTLTATNPANGCTTTSTVQVFPSAGAPTVTNNPVTNTITCTNTLVTVSITTTATPVSYTWTGIGIVGATNTSSITVNQGGTFQYTVTNTSSGCSTSNNQVVIQNTTIPTTTASTTGTLTCSTSTVALNSTLAGMNYTWTAPAGGSVGSANTQSTTASGAAGTYSLTVLDPANGCSYSTTTTVTQNTVVPTTTASTTGTLTCSTSTVALNSTLGGMNYTWTAPAGGSVGSANTQSTAASGAAGIYSLTVVNPVNGCSFLTTTSVTQNTAVPTTVASTTGTLTCTTTTVALNSSLAGMNYTWTAPAGGSVGSANTQSTTASGAPGTYSLLVVNPSTGCTFATTSSVTQSISVPTTTASTTGTLTCSSTTVALNSTLSGMNYTWTAPAGGSVGSANTQSTTASGAPGTYSLLVVNPSTGCTFATTTSVSQNTTVPTTAASTTGTLTCITTTVALNSTLSGMNYTWAAPAGGSVGSANTQSTSASGAAGTYSLTVVDPANGCSFLTTTSVTQNTTVPATTASTTGTLTCISSTVALNSTLAGMSYTWTAPAGGSVGNANAQSTTASGAAGTYSLLVVNPSTGCTFATSTAVTQNTTAPTGVSAGANQTLGCGSATVVTLSGSATTPTNATANWSGPSVSGSTTSFTTSANGAGIYTLTVTNPSNGCTATSTVQVMPNAGAPALTIDPVTNTITCTNTLVTVSISTTVSPVSYSWSGTGIVSGNGTGTITVNQGGTLNFTLTNTTNSCTASGSTVVVQNTTVPTTTASTTGTLTCANATVDLNSTLAGMNYTWTAPAGGTVGSANTQSTTASGTSGTYSLLVIDSSNGCSFTSTTAVSQNTAAPTTVASSTGTLTCVTSTVDLTSTLAGMDYTWTAPAGGSVSTSSTQATVASGAPGDYTLTVSDPSNGCTYTTSANVPQNITLPTGVSAGSGQTLTCPSNSVTLTGSVSTPTNPTINWAGPNVCGTATTIVTSACAAGDYTLTVTDPMNGCSTSSVVTISPNAGSPTVTTSSSALVIDCNNATQSVTVTSTPTADVTYSWSPAPSSVSASGEVATFNAPDTYTCTVTNTISNCSTPVQVVVTENTVAPLIAISNTQTLTCITTTVAITLTTTPTSGLTYTWSSASAFLGQGNDTIVVNMADGYSVSVMDAVNGCTNTASTIVAQNTVAPVLSAGANQTLSCSSSSVTLTGSITSPTNAVVDWGTSVCGTQTTVVTEACAAGVYTLTATDPSNGCVAASTVTVFANAGAPTATPSSTALTIDCNNATQSVTITSVPSTDVTYSWTPSPLSTSASGDVATFDSQNTYICTVTNTITNCSTPVQVIVTSDLTPPVILISGTQTLTCAPPTAVISTTATGTYTWTGTSPIVSGQGTGSITVNAGGDYSVVVTAANGCTNTASSHIDADQNVPNVTITATSSNSMITCQNPTVTLTASVTPPATYSYTWAPSGNGGMNESVTGPGLYNVIVLNATTGCTATTSQQFTVTGSTTPPTVIASNTVIPCGSPSVAISANASNVSYSWTTSNGTILSGAGLSSAVAGSTGQYEVTVTDNINGCTNTATVNVTSVAVTAAFSANPTSGTAPLLVNFTNQTPGAGNIYSWTFGDDNNNTSSLTNPDHIFNTTGTYTVVLLVTDASGLCSATASVTIEVFENFSIIVPNVFTPNGDGSNDLFKITATGIEEFNCDIFDRWGLKLTTLKTVNDAWDGSGNSAGTYFFILTAKGYDGKEHKQEGFISLFK